MLVAMLVFGALAVVDLLTGFLLDDWCFDVLILAGCAFGVWGFLELRWLAGRVRANQIPRQLSVVRWLGIVASSVLCVGLVAGIGYMVGGSWLAVVFVAPLIVLVSSAVVSGVRHRRRTAN